MMVILNRSKIKKSFIDHLKELSNFSNESKTVKYMDQMVGLDEVKYFAMLKDDGAFEVKPMMHHLCKVEWFVSFYNRWSQ
jgi:hypothetical protein